MSSLLSILYTHGSVNSAELIVVLHAKLDAATPATQSREHHDGPGDRPSLIL